MSHDRNFLDNVVTSTIVFEEGGRIREYVGGYSDWVRQGHRLAETDRPDAGHEKADRERQRRENRRQTKLSYKDQRELDQLRVELLQARIAEPDYYSQDAGSVQAGLAELKETEALLESRIERWGELEDLRESLVSGSQVTPPPH